jgi:hypothetical protein
MIILRTVYFITNTTSTTGLVRLCREPIFVKACNTSHIRHAAWTDLRSRPNIAVLLRHYLADAVLSPKTARQHHSNGNGCCLTIHLNTGSRLLSRLFIHNYTIGLVLKSRTRFDIDTYAQQQRSAYHNLPCPSCCKPTLTHPLPLPPLLQNQLIDPAIRPAPHRLIPPPLMHRLRGKTHHS